MARRKTRPKRVPKQDVEFMRLRLSEFHRFVLETAELFGDAFTLNMLGNAVADLGYPSASIHRLAERARGQ